MTCASCSSSCFFFQRSEKSDTLSSKTAYYLLVFFKMKNTFKPNHSEPFDNSIKHPNSEFSRALPFLDFVYRTDGINGVAQLYRSVVCESNFENSEKVCKFYMNHYAFTNLSILFNSNPLFLPFVRSIRIPQFLEI